MTAIIIIIAAIFGAVLSVYLKQLSHRHSDEAHNHYDPFNPQTTILHSIEPNSPDVKTLYEVFSWGREAMAEYLYYGEIDHLAVNEDGTGDLSKAAFHAEVSVSFEQDVIDAETQNLKNYRRHGFKSPRFSIENERGRDVSQTTNTQDYESLIDLSDQHYSQFRVVGFAQNICFRYTRIEPNRVISIVVVANEAFATIEWMYQHFNDLVERYRILPMQEFSGAIRE